MFVRATFLTAMALMTGTALAQSAPADLVAAYKAGVAAAKCDLGLDSAKSSQLETPSSALNRKAALGKTNWMTSGPGRKAMPKPTAPPIAPARLAILIPS